MALAHSRFMPVINHVWGSAISVATNIHRLTAMPPMPTSFPSIWACKAFIQMVQRSKSISSAANAQVKISV